MKIKKKLYIAIFLFLFSFTIYDIYYPYFNITSYIEKRWNISLPFKVNFKNIIEINRRDFVKINISKKEKEKFLATNMNIFGYTSWSVKDKGFKMQGLDIDGKDYFTSNINKQPNLTYKKIYINKFKNEVIFLDYYWGGY